MIEIDDPNKQSEITFEGVPNRTDNNKTTDRLDWDLLKQDSRAIGLKLVNVYKKILPFVSLIKTETNRDVFIGIVHTVNDLSIKLKLNVIDPTLNKHGVVNDTNPDGTPNKLGVDDGMEYLKIHQDMNNVYHEIVAFLGGVVTDFLIKANQLTLTKEEQNDPKYITIQNEILLILQTYNNTKE